MALITIKKKSLDIIYLEGWLTQKLEAYTVCICILMLKFKVHAIWGRWILLSLKYSVYKKNKHVITILDVWFDYWKCMLISCATKYWLQTGMMNSYWKVFPALLRRLQTYRQTFLSIHTHFFLQAFNFLCPGFEKWQNTETISCNLRCAINVQWFSYLHTCSIYLHIISIKYRSLRYNNHNFIVLLQ